MQEFEPRVGDGATPEVEAGEGGCPFPQGGGFLEGPVVDVPVSPDDDRDQGPAVQVGNPRQVTPFGMNMLVRRVQPAIAEAESSVVSDLRANKIVGFSIQVTDIDEDEFIHDAYILGNFTGKRSDLGSDAHTWVDGVLLPGDDKSVVEDKAWGRIKASLLE